MVFGFLARRRVGSRIAHALRAVASAVATVFGVLLLVADSTDDCEEYKPLSTAFAYSTDCALGSSGASGTGASGTGASGTGASGTGASGSGGSGAAGNPALRTGQVSLSLPGDPDLADEHAYNEMRTGGLNVVSASISYEGECSGGEGIGTVRGVGVTLGSPGLSEFRCARFALPVKREKTVTCTQTIDAGANPTTCSLTVAPLPK